MTTEDKYACLVNEVYEYVTHSHTGSLLIKTKYCLKAAKILGGDYNHLSKVGKAIFRKDLVFEDLRIEEGFNKYLEY